MPRLSTPSSTHRKSGEQRIFADESGRLWSATDTDVAVVFTCVTDGRKSGRAIAIDLSMVEEEPGDETLRAWLRAAPQIGRLT